MYDDSATMNQDEKTPFASSSLYGLAKITEGSLVKYYRNKGLHASVAILFNHESSRRSDSFVTKKIVKNLVAYKKGKIKSFTLGALDFKKDWGYAKDYVNAIYLMAQQNLADDYIVASGVNYSIEQFVQIAADKLGIDNWRVAVELNKNILSRKVNTNLLGNCELTKKKLGWEHTLDLGSLIELMIKNELEGDLK